jgi:hypothetical protein
MPLVPAKARAKTEGKTKMSAVPAKKNQVTSAPVVAQISITDAAFRPYLDAVVSGKATHGLLPAPLSGIALTESQRDELRAARKDNALFAKEHSKLIDRMLKKKCFERAGFRMAKNLNTTLRFAVVKERKDAATKAVEQFQAAVAKA